MLVPFASCQQLLLRRRGKHRLSSRDSSPPPDLARDAPSIRRWRSPSCSEDLAENHCLAPLITWISDTGSTVPFQLKLRSSKWNYGVGECPTICPKMCKVLVMKMYIEDNCHMQADNAPMSPWLHQYFKCIRYSNNNFWRHSNPGKHIQIFLSTRSSP